MAVQAHVYRESNNGKSLKLVYSTSPCSEKKYAVRAAEAHPLYRSEYRVFTDVEKQQPAKE